MEFPIFKHRSHFAYANVITLIIGFILSGCAGYHLGPAKPSYLINVHRIAVPTFRNDTLTPRIEALATGSVVKCLEADGTYEIVGSTSCAADAVLEASVEEFTKTPTRSIRGNVLLTSEFTLRVAIQYRLIEQGTCCILAAGRAEGSTNFFVTGDIVQDERQATPLAVEQAAARLTSQLADGF